MFSFRKKRLEKELKELREIRNTIIGKMVVQRKLVAQTETLMEKGKASVADLNSTIKEKEKELSKLS